MTGKRIYIAGPMTGVPRFNRPRFQQSARILRAQGWTVESPVEIAAAFGSDNTIVTTPGMLDAVIEAELAALAKCDAIYLLAGWEDSRGAKRELWLALDKGLEVIVEGRGVGARLLRKWKKDEEED